MPSEEVADNTAEIKPGRHRRRRRWLTAVRQATVTAARAVRDWSHRPSGRLTLPGLLLLTLVSASGAAGALLVPAAVPATRSDSTAAGPDPDLAMTAAPATPEAPAVPDLPTATDAPSPTGSSTATAPERPSDPLASWAQEVGGRIGIPAQALQAYGYAEWVLSQTTPGCRLRWTTLAAIGHVESNHGRTQGATIGPDGVARPSIIGLPLDGKGGRKLIADTDQGRLDGDTTYDRAVGPMQFIPTTWQQSGVDGNGDGVKDPHNIDDAALAAAQYLCRGGRDLTKPQDWWQAILSYNNVQSYAQKVFDTANDYGVRSRG